MQPKLDTDLKLIIAQLGLRFDQIITSAQFVVVGRFLTVVITCGSKNAKNW